MNDLWQMNPSSKTLTNCVKVEESEVFSRPWKKVHTLEIRDLEHAIYGFKPWGEDQCAERKVHIIFSSLSRADGERHRGGNVWFTKIHNMKKSVFLFQFVEFLCTNVNSSLMDLIHLHFLYKQKWNVCCIELINFFSCTTDLTLYLLNHERAFYISMTYLNNEKAHTTVLTQCLFKDSKIAHYSSNSISV